MTIVLLLQLMLPFNYVYFNLRAMVARLSLYTNYSIITYYFGIS